MVNIVLFAGNDLCRCMFSDIARLDNWEAIEDLIYTKSKILKLIFRIHTSVKVNNIINLPFKSIWVNRFNPLRRYPFKKGTKYHVLLINPVFEKYNLYDFVNLQKRYDVKYTLVMIDTLNTKSGRVVLESLKLLKYDNIYTFDLLDSIKYGFHYTNSMYSMRTNVSETAMKSDIYFIGRDKGRKDFLIDLFNILSDNGCVCDFTINGVEKNAVVQGVKTGRGILYNQVIQEIQSTNCILEVIQQGQNGVTLRYYEAVCYNKKLLTNNADIVNYPFYNPEYMKVFTKLEDIDVKWIKEQVDVNYKYNGEYSPINLVLEGKEHD